MTELQAFKLCREVARQHPKPKIILISASERDLFFQADACATGACACLPRYLGDDELCRAIRNIAAGYMLISADALALATMPIELSNAEHLVLSYLAQGLSNQEIADRLNNALGTVKVHVKHILSKLQVSSREAAVLRAQRLGLIGESTP